MADDKKSGSDSNHPNPAPVAPSNKSPVATVQQQQASFVASKESAQIGYIEQRDAQVAAARYQALFGGVWTVTSSRGRWDVVRSS